MSAVQKIVAVVFIAGGSLFTTSAFACSVSCTDATGVANSCSSVCKNEQDASCTCDNGLATCTCAGPMTPVSGSSENPVSDEETPQSP